MAAKSIRDCKVGDILGGRWRLERVLGVGGMARVFAATHRNAHRVAIKVLRPELVRDRALCARFLREGYAANKVEHRGTVRVLDDDLTPTGVPFLVMELLEGETLGARLARLGPLDPGEVQVIAEQVLDMLVAAHARGVVHRDIKPENLFVTLEGHLKVLDFGLARIRENPRGRANSVRFGSVLGTPAYMAPEQARGHWDAVDERTDLWALGATLFTLSTGRFVHEGATKEAQIAAAVKLPAPAVRERSARVPPALAELIDRALAFEPDRRWESAEAMLAAVRSIDLGASREVAPPPCPVEAAPPRPPEAADTDTWPAITLQRRPRRGRLRRAWLFGIGTLALLVAISATVVRRGAVVPAPARSLAVH